MMIEPMKKSQILYAQNEDDIVVIRVEGRGNHELSHALKNVVKKFNTRDFSPRYIIDIKDCICLDSTFMGTMAAMALHQTTCRKDRASVVNSNATTERQLTMLGLNYLLDIRTASAKESKKDTEFQKAEAAQPESRFDQILHMIEAHETLVDADSGNEIKFQAVLKTLGESLRREQR